MLVKPFLKWAGGKSQLLEQIRAHYPVGLGKDITKYAEPFVGGGAVLFDILSRYNIAEVYISDINRELIATYKLIRDNVNILINRLECLQEEFLPLSDTERKKYYYNTRNRYNELIAVRDKSDEIAALFIFLNKTCFNGLYRVNGKGEYNVPMGSYKNITICDRENLTAVSNALKNVTVVCGDYKNSREFIDSNTFAYFDPPYRPLSATSSFNSYNESGFGDKEQAELADFIDEMSQKGAKILASNSDPKNTDNNDDFFDKIYAKHGIHRISAVRMINSVSNRRGRVSEILVDNKVG